MKKYIKEILLVIIIIEVAGLYVAGYFCVYFNPRKENSVIEEMPVLTIPEKEEIKTEEKVVETKQESKYVEIKGSVASPGVYLIKDGNIINDIIRKAGGFLEGAYTNNINLSKKVNSEMVIYVHSKDEMTSETKEKVEQVVCECPSYDITPCLNENASMIVTKEETETKSEESEESHLVNINTASIEELTSLTGIGEAKAKAIISYREKEKFLNKEDIQKVSGISNTIYEKIKENITV